MFCQVDGHFSLYRRNSSYSAMNADIQDMEERIMMEQRLLKEVTEEIILLRLSKDMTHMNHFLFHLISYMAHIL